MANHEFFVKFSTAVSHAAGRPQAFVLACTGIVVWAVTGPLFGFSETWQLVVNTGTTIITFLMVFVLQNSQNRDGAAVQAKLDELIRVSAGTNRLIGSEHLSEEELEHIHDVIAEAAARHDRQQQGTAQAG
ncbi:MAG TPA: low affinity iron permease family protein [Devosia sp.]|nr:low affinity iron permease family protein [Devosia sp.]